MPPVSRKALLPLIKVALREDRARQDLTSRAVLPASLRIRTRIVAKSPGILAGVKLAALVFTTLDPSLRCRLHRHSGATLKQGTVILTVEGRARSIFAAERTALNFLGHLSGIATLTRTFMDRARGTRARILDTRKTLPGLRALEKDAVRAGGGMSHRSSLSDAILIKTNHIKAMAREAYLVKREACVEQAVRQAKRVANGKFVEVEVTNISEFRVALRARPRAILLDNWAITDIRKAVRLRRTLHANTLIRFTQLEVSGGITLANVRAIARTGVDRISIGRLTHSAPALDMSLQVI